MTTSAGTRFDRRRAQTIVRVPALSVLQFQTESRAVPAFDVGQTVVTLRGKLTVKRRWFGSVVNMNLEDWHYVFGVAGQPQRLPNGVLLSGGSFEYAYTETDLLPLQLAAIPPIAPTTVKPDLSPAGENHDSWCDNLIAWVDARREE